MSQHQSRTDTAADDSDTRQPLHYTAETDAEYSINQPDSEQPQNADTTDSKSKDTIPDLVDEYHGQLYE